MKGWPMNKKKSLLPKKGEFLQSKGSSMGTPSFDSMLDPTGMPNIPITKSTDTEQIVNEEVDSMMQMIRENRKNNAEHFRDIESGEFWFCVCFQSRTQKEDFVQKLLEKYGSPISLEEFGNKYLSGLEFAAMLGINIEPIKLEVKKNRLAPKLLRKMEVI
jgi:hypothetical protein